MSKPGPELYQNDALDRRRAGVLPVWQIVAGIMMRLAAVVTGLFAAISGRFGVRWLTIAHLYETGIVLLLTAATFLAMALGMFWLSRRLYPPRRERDASITH